MEDKDVEHGSSHPDTSEKLARMPTDDTSDWHLGFHIYLVLSTLPYCIYVIHMYGILVDLSFLLRLEGCVLVIWAAMRSYSYSSCPLVKFT